MNTVVKFPSGRLQGEVREVRVADVENGYLRIANELYEALIGAELTRNQAKVAHAIVRKTYGFNKPFDRITDSQLGELTRLPRQKVNKAKNELLMMGVLTRVGREIGLNGVISDWNTACHQNRDSVTKTVTKSVSKTVTGLSPKQGHTKDTIQKTRKTNTDGASANADAPAATAPDKPVKHTSPVPYQTIVDTYHAVLPEMPAIRELTDARKTKIRLFWHKFKFTDVRWRSYLQHIATHCRWMCESRPRRDGDSAWKPKNLDFLITERCYLGVREGRFNDC